MPVLIAKTFENEVDRFVKFMESCNTPYNTKRNYRGYLIDFFNWITTEKGGCEDIATLPWEYFREHQKFLMDANSLKGNTANQHLCALRMFYEGVMEREWNSKAVPKAKYDKYHGPVPVAGEVAIIIQNTPEINHRLEIEFMAFCGLRVSEVVELHFSDIRRIRGTLYVRPSKNHGDREVPLAPSVLSELERYYRCLPYPRPSKDDFIFPGLKPDTHVTEATVENHVKDVMKKLGWEDRKYTCHAFRRFFGCDEYLANPNDIPRLAALMGHNSISSTMVYIRLAAAFQAAKQHGDRVDQLMKGVIGNGWS